MFKNVKVENPVRHLVQVSEGDFGCADLELRREIWTRGLIQQKSLGTCSDF